MASSIAIYGVRVHHLRRMARKEVLKGFWNGGGSLEARTQLGVSLVYGPIDKVRADLY